ncbi:MAG: hypothetical protein IIY78_08350 [Clostridia bacterium]|nr:hypothetical protein [Clostridia bacterium]
MRLLFRYYIAKLDRRLTRAAQGQVRKLKESDTDYFTAVRCGIFLQPTA